MFVHYTRTNVCNSLGLSRTQMKLLAVVSKTDYFTNVRGYGLHKNRKLIQTIPDNPLFVMELRYMSKVKALKLKNGHAQDIFLNRKENLLKNNAADAYQLSMQNQLNSILG